MTVPQNVSQCLRNHFDMVSSVSLNYLLVNSDVSRPKLKTRYMIYLDCKIRQDTFDPCRLDPDNVQHGLCRSSYLQDIIKACRIWVLVALIFTSCSPGFLRPTPSSLNMRFIVAIFISLVTIVASVSAVPVRTCTRGYHGSLEAHAINDLYCRGYEYGDIYSRSSYYPEPRSYAQSIDVRDVYEQLVRRAKAKGKDNKKGGKMIKGSGNGELPISWTGTAKAELAEPLAATWGNGDDAKARHEAIVREYGDSIKKAKSAQIEHAAHPGGTDPNEKDHITVKYFDKNGGIIKDKNDWDSHHVYTNREKEVLVTGSPVTIHLFLFQTLFTLYFALCLNSHAFCYQQCSYIPVCCVISCYIAAHTQPSRCS
ncbi:hypothetical protein ABKN59_001661 [Abortiporus biennis]